jgi:hypothetical protein
MDARASRNAGGRQRIAAGQCGLGQQASEVAMSLWLTEDELIELTGYRQVTKQRQALAELRVQFRSRPADGFPLVARALFTSTDTKPTKRLEPNFGASYG